MHIFKVRASYDMLSSLHVNMHLYKRASLHVKMHLYIRNVKSTCGKSITRVHLYMCALTRVHPLHVCILNIRTSTNVFIFRCVHPYMCAYVLLKHRCKVHLYMCAYFTCVHPNTCASEDMCASLHVCILTCVHPYMCASLHVCIFTCVHLYMRASLHVCIFKVIYDCYCR